MEKGRRREWMPQIIPDRNDAYPYLERTGSLIMTGPTGTNVNELGFVFAFTCAQNSA